MSNRGGFRANSGRKKIQGSRHTYTVPDYVHEYIHVRGDGLCVKKLVDDVLNDHSENEI